MSKKLLIVESPSKAKTISKYLGKDYIVTASVGHVRDLPKSNKKAVDIENGFIPHYEISKGKEKVVAEIKSLAEKADDVILATDPDREGEAIAWHLRELIDPKHKRKDIKRAVYHEITKEAVEEALEHPREIDENLRKAQEARRVLDRLVGYDLSGLIWKKVRYGLSAGRVQSPALRIIMEREREIRAFIPETFWRIFADTETVGKKPLALTCSTEPRGKKEVEKILSAGKSENWTVSNVSETNTTRASRAPFTTSTLQQVASTRLGFAPSRTMQVAQKLYEAGLITYMRTDSVNLSAQAVASIQSLIKSRYGEKYTEGPKKYTAKSKNAQEAHEAIRPSHIEKENAGSTPEQKNLYSLIWERTVASQMADAKILRTKITAKIGTDENIPVFEANGSRTLFDGWIKADPDSRGEEVELPKVSIGEKLKFIEIKTEEKQTEPPGRYTEAGLVKELEKRDIGRPSTYASIIKTLADRGYVDKVNRSLVPTDTGDVVSTFVENNFADYISDTFTAEMENDLDKIAEGEKEYTKTLETFYKPFNKAVKSKEKIEKITNLGDAPANMKCPKCGSKMIIKLGKTGKFYSCSKFPDCSGALTLEGKEIAGPKETGEKCPDCGSPLVEREGKYGKFISCSNYPKCKYIKKDGIAQPTTGIKCPKCQTGEMAERRGRFGVFYSCNNYPKCKYAINAKPTGNICRLCGSLMMTGTKTIPERCSDKACANHRPDKLK